MHNEIKLVNVSFSYPDHSNYALSNICLTIKNGESIGFIGASGSGKSTLIDVILGLLPPSKGQILVDGINIRNDICSWQNQIGYVPQSIYITDDTLRRNIAFGLPEDQIDNDAIEVAIKLAQLETFVKTLPLELETVLGERGVRLSGGQRQRIGIARALYHNPSVLVLDEATSALDTDTEMEVMNSVKALQGDKTILIVAHRLSTIEHCDRVYGLDNGEIAKEGIPADILVKQKKSPTN